MDFKKAYSKMIFEDKKIKRPLFTGYWYFNRDIGQVVIHCGDGREITRSDDITLTVMNTTFSDWLIMDD